MTRTQAEGIVLRNYGGFYYVQNGESGIHECRLRGKIRDRVLTGDRVRVTLLEAGKGVVEEILPRRSELRRPPVANVDMVLIVMSFDKPTPDLALLDRLLVLADYQEITPCIVLNKSDIAPTTRAECIMDYYPRVGYRLVNTSAKKREGIEELARVLTGRVAVLAGPSGAGKSSLLNALLPELSLATREVSRKIGRGRHTTRHVELFYLDSGGWIADTPGFSILDLPPMKRQELARHFIEFEEPARWCRFNDCLHDQERECGVKEAVDRGEIATFRYHHYLSFLVEVKENERCYN